ncbi:MAG: hypothetical protein K0S37_3759 [Microbacterium sp.]|nr:hypothetical protein [Microbacterium sp.]
MTFAPDSGRPIPASSGWAWTSSRRNDGTLVLDVSGAFADNTRLPLLVFCERCQVPVFERWIAATDVPIEDFVPRSRCDRGHRTVLSDYLSIFDGSPYMEPRMLHARRPTERALLGSGWLTRHEADALYAAVKALLSGPDANLDAAMAAATAAVPGVAQLLPSTPWTRGDRIALAGLLVAILAIIAPLLQDSSAEAQLTQIIDQQQELIEMQRDLVEDMRDGDPPAHDDHRFPMLHGQEPPTTS